MEDSIGSFFVNRKEDVLGKRSIRGGDDYLSHVIMNLHLNIDENKIVRAN